MVACKSEAVRLCSVVRRWNALFLHVSSSLLVLDGMYMIVHERDMTYSVHCGSSWYMIMLYTTVQYCTVHDFRFHSQRSSGTVLAFSSTT